MWTLNGDGEPVPNNIVRLSHSGNSQQFEYTQVSVGEGYSGAPVFNDSGQLIGIHDEETSRSDYKLSVAVKIESAIETLDALGYPTAPMNVLVQGRPGTLSPPAQGLQMQNALVASGAPAGAPAATQTGTAKPAQVWRNTINNQLYLFRSDGAHMYITRKDGAVIGDLALTQDKKGVTKYVGTSSLSNCPGGGYTEINDVSATRIDGRTEQKHQWPVCGLQQCKPAFQPGRLQPAADDPARFHPGTITGSHRMLIARAASSAIVINEMLACTIISTLAQRESTGTSVGEKAVLVLKARNR